MEDTKKKKKSEYDVAYAKTNIKRVPLDMQKSDYERLKVVAASCGEKVNEYIKKAIRQRMERDTDFGEIPEDSKGALSIFDMHVTDQTGGGFGNSEGHNYE